MQLLIRGLDCHRRTMYYQMQTRSADEPMTTFVTYVFCLNHRLRRLLTVLEYSCLSCNNRWKFS